MLVEISYIGQRGTNQAILEALNYVPQQFRTQSPIRDNNAETFLSQVVSNPFQGLTPDSPGSQRRDHRAPPPALRLPAVRFIGQSVRHRDDQHVLHRNRARLEHVPRRDLSARQAIHGRSDADDVLHVVPPDESRSRHSIPGTSSRIASAPPIGRIASRSPASRSCPSAANAGSAVTGIRLSTVFWAAGSSARSTNGRAARRWCSTRTPTSIPPAAIRAI